VRGRWSWNYWHTNQIGHLLADGFQVLVPPDSMIRQGARPGWERGMYSFMRRILSTDLGRQLYIKQAQHRAGVRADQAPPRDDSVPDLTSLVTPSSTTFSGPEALAASSPTALGSHRGRDPGRIGC
jgi:hypothetical protein